MEVATKFLSRQFFLFLGIISLFVSNGAFSKEVMMYPKDFSMQPCDLANGIEGICVYGYLCRDNIVNIDGNGLIDLRFSDVCEDYFLKCCSKETPCLENTGTCVPNSNCGANLNDPRNKKFKPTDECDWSGYTCCPNNKIGQIKVSNQTDKERCDVDSLCVPLDQCKVNPDGDGLLEARTSTCSSSQHTCCPESMIRGAERDTIQGAESSGNDANSIEQYETCDEHTVCVPDDRCLVKPDGDNIIQPRVTFCGGMNQTCCPRDKVKGDDPCSEVGGTCKQGNSCPASSSLMFDIRIAQCEEPGFVCCMQDATEVKDQFIGKTCSGGSGKCTPRKQCRGTTYRDRNMECGGLACCASLPTSTAKPSVSTSTTPKHGDNARDGVACSNNLGWCTRGNCGGIKFTDRKNECAGLNCCGPSDVTSTTPKHGDNARDGVACSNNLGRCTRGNCGGMKFTDRKNECAGLNCCGFSDVTSTTQKPSRATTPTPIPEGQACNYKQGICSSESCPGEEYGDMNNECGGLNCCAEPSTVPPLPDRSCNSIGGKCVQEGNCYGNTESTVHGCNFNEVCCVQVDPRPDQELKECGYRNENGVKFGTTGREDGESQFGEFPWMVAIMTNEKGKISFICGGSLIDLEVVLTSAECVKSFKTTPHKLIVRAGEWDMGTTREPISYEERQVIKIKSHPEFKATTLVNNIALLFLDDKFDQSLTINTVCLPPQNFAIDNGEVTASGWGSTPQDRTRIQQILKSIDLRYYDRTECERVFRKGMRSFKLHRSFICAGGDPGVDTCRGDAGSPIVHPVPNDVDSRYYAVGMVAWGIGCGKPGVPAAYTDVAFFRDWIDSAMQTEGLQTHSYTYIRQDEDKGEDYQQF